LWVTSPARSASAPRNGPLSTARIYPEIDEILDFLPENQNFVDLGEYRRAGYRVTAG
jgi:hypothetical protein